MLSVADAQKRILDSIAPVESISIPLTEAAHSWLAEEVVARVALPPFDNSAMDGYAVRACETSRATRETPALLKCVGIIPAGKTFEETLAAGQCVRIFTGAPMPAGADAVVMQEDCTNSPESSDIVAVNCPVTPWENVRFAGEDVKAGAAIGARGDQLTAPRLGLLAASGIAEVLCHRRPRVGLLSTGDELVALGVPLKAGEIYESNRVALAAVCHRTGAEIVSNVASADSRASLAARLAEAFVAADIVFSTGGVSVGEFDFVKEAFGDLGGKTEFWRVAMKPGKPLVFGTVGGKLFLGLPGNPVSALVGMALFGVPALQKLAGAREVMPPVRRALLAAPLQNRGDRPHYVRVIVDAEGLARSAGVQASHVLLSAACANGLVEVPPNETLAAGIPVAVIPWG